MSFLPSVQKHVKSVLVYEFVWSHLKMFSSFIRVMTITNVILLIYNNFIQISV